VHHSPRYPWRGEKLFSHELLVRAGESGGVFRRFDLVLGISGGFLGGIEARTGDGFLLVG